MKIFAIITLMVTVILFNAESKTAKFGVKGRRDVLLYTKDIIKVCESENGCSELIKFPDDGDINEKIITFIYCQDELGESGSAKVKLIAGGFGEKKAEINIEAKQGDAINFEIEVYGKQFVRSQLFFQYFYNLV